MAWLGIPEALDRLSYPHDTGVVEEFAAGPPDTIPFILIRHASAGNKDDWRAAGHDDDLLRPLDEEGLRQGQELAALLQCYATGQVFSSLAERCIATVQPYADAIGQDVQADPSLTVGLAAAGDARRRVDEILGSRLPAVLCGHRENLSLILEEACAVLGAKATESGPLPLAGFWVLHIGWHILASQEEHHLVDS